MRRSLLTCIRFASLVLLWTGVLQNLVIGQENYPGYDFGSSPSRAQSLWSGEPRIGKIDNETPKSPRGQIHYASQPQRHPTAPPVNNGGYQFGPAAQYGLGHQYGANRGSGFPANAYQGVNPPNRQPFGEVAQGGMLPGGIQQGIPAAPAGVAFGQPGGQVLPRGIVQPGLQGVGQPGLPLNQSIQQVSPLGIPLESMAPAESVLPAQSPLETTLGGPAAGGAGVGAGTATSAVNEGWMSGNFDTSGNYNIANNYDGNFLNGNTGPASGYNSAPTTASQGQGGRPAANKSGLFFRWDRLWATIDAPAVGEVGDQASEGVFVSNGITSPFFNSLSGDFIDDRPDWGDRVEFGFTDPNRKCGWMGSVLNLAQAKTTVLAGGTVQFSDPYGMLLGFVDGNGDGIDDDLDGDRIYGRSGRDLGTPDAENPGSFFPFFDGIPDDTSTQDNGDLATFLPVFDELEVSNRLDITGFELTRFRGFGRGNRPFAHILLGVRYVDMDEDFYLRGSGSFLDETTVRTKVENFIIGPQVGVGFCRNHGAWGLNGSARALAGINRQRGQQTAILASNATDSMGAANAPLNLNPSASSTSQKSTQFSPFFEIRGNVYYNLNSWLSINAGYTGWYASGISRAAGSIEYSLPTFGFDIDNNDDLLAHALTFGLQGNW